MKQIVSKDKTVIGYQKSGQGRPLLFVHGVTADHRSWTAVSSHLEQEFTTYAMDRRGRGGSGDSPDYDLWREAGDVVALVESIGEPTAVLGHSYGGLICLEASLQTDNIAQLILYEPAVPTETPHIQPEVIERIKALVEQDELEKAMEVCLREVAEIPDHDIDIYRQSPLWAARIPLARTIPRELETDLSYTFQAERFANMQTLTALLLGGDSPLLYRQGVERLDAALPNSQIIILPGQQHIAHHANPELLAAAVRQFLSG
jgi:pimeloyl-ACP methyl ester carboxylesterase